MAGKRDRTDGSHDQLTFEQALARLEAVVRLLEDGQLGLDESLANYEEGVRLLKLCRESLQGAERKIMLLTGLDADGNPVCEPFSDEATSLEAKKELRSHRRSRTSSGEVGRNESIDDNDDDGARESDRQKGLF